MYMYTCTYLSTEVDTNLTSYEDPRSLRNARIAERVLEQVIGF